MFNPLKNNDMKMKLRSFMMLLALAGMAASCSNDDLTENGGTGITGNNPEIQLSFSGSGESQEYERSARAIATESENKIDQLSVYLFAAASAAGPYYYMEKWEEGTAYEPATPAVTNFKKQASGTGWKASIYPNEMKGLPYIKLMCIANNGVPAGSTTDGKFYAEDGKTELAALTAVTVDGDGKITNAGAATTESDFKKAHTMNLGVDAATGIITAPLMMTGEGETKISGSVSKVKIDLRRIMARFDIDNTTSRSNLTIQKITLAHGRKAGALFGAALTPVAEADLDKVEDANFVVKYQTVDFTTIQGANQGVAESALYAYPNLATDKSYLIIEGTYKSPITSAQVPVTYNIDIARTTDANPDAQFIPVKANSRYKLRITDVTQSNIFGSFEVVDWTSGGGINVKPDNDSPVFAGAAAFTGANIPTQLVDADHPEILNYEVTGIGGNGSFDIEMAATGKVRVEKGSVARAATDWLEIVQSGDPEERDGVWYTKFSVSYTNAIGQQPVAATFINDAASYDPALWTVINFYGPKAQPEFAVIANGNSKGNLTNADDPLAPTASIYAMKNSYVMFEITSIEGVKVSNVPAGYSVTNVTATEKPADFKYTYKISATDESIADAHIIFENAADASKVTSLDVTVQDPRMTFTEVAANPAINNTTPSDRTQAVLFIDLDALNTSYEFKLESPAGGTATIGTCEWLTITEGHTWQNVDGERYNSYTVTKKANPVNTLDAQLVFVNELSETNIDAPGMTVAFHKAPGKPKLEIGTTTASWSTWNVGLGTPDFSDPYAAAIDMYTVDNSTITVKMSCTEAAYFKVVPALTVSQIGSTDEYTISVADAIMFGAGTTTDVVAINSSAAATNPATDRKATLTITWKDPAITFEKTLDTANAATVTDDQIDVVGSTFKDSYGTLKLKIKGVKGSTIAVSDLSSTWAGAQGAVPTVIPESGEAEITFSAGAAVNDADTADITITVTNAITGGGDKTITLSKK